MKFSLYRGYLGWYWQLTWGPDDPYIGPFPTKSEARHDALEKNPANHRKGANSSAQ